MRCYFETVVAGRRFLAALLSATALAAACGGTSTGKGNGENDCVALCEKAKAVGCKGSEALGNCDDNCLQEDARVETTGCRATYDDTLGCTAALEDVCTVQSSCRTELLGYFVCVNAWCEGHSADFCM